MRRNVAPTTSSRNASVLNKTLPQFLLVGFVLIALGTCGYWLLFTQFMVYDDEGYVLWSLHNYFQEGGLYTKVYSQYGPFLYVLYQCIHTLLGIAFDNETGRLLTLGYWLGASGLSGAFVWQQTRNLVAALTTSALSFSALLIMINEPIHPGGLLALITAIGAVGGAFALAKERYRTLVILSGLCVAALTLTKINVGAFFLIATLSWFAIHAAKSTHARALLWFTAGGSILLPLWLMQKLWPEPWVATFALSFSSAALSILLLIKQQHRTTFKITHILWFVGSGAVASIIVLLAVWARGTGFGTLWHGIVIAPLNQPVAYSHAVNWPEGITLLILMMIGMVLLAQTRQNKWVAPTVALLRMVVAGGMLFLTFSSIDNSLTFFSFHYGLPFAWLMAISIREQHPTTLKSARLWVAWLFTWQTLHAYPVAGSQMGWGAFLFIPLAVGGIHEAILYLTEYAPKFRRAIRIAAGLAAFTAIFSVIWNLGKASHLRYSLGEPLGLKGAASLRLSDDNTLLYRILDKNIRMHGDILFSYPGLYSLNIWTEVPTPTALNVTHWFSLLSDEQQLEILKKLKAEDRSVIVVQSYLVNYLVYHGFPPRSVLQRYIIDHFEAVFTIDTYQLWVKKGRSIAPISTAGLYTNPQANDTIMQLVTDAEGEIATVEIRGLYYPYNRVAVLSPDVSSPWSIQSIKPDNSVIGHPLITTEPCRIEGITRLNIPMPGAHELPDPSILKVVIKDVDGNLLDTLPFTN